MQYVERGYRMDPPDGSPDAIYKIMRSCWDHEPQNRPSFSKVAKTLETVPSSWKLVVHY